MSLTTWLVWFTSSVLTAIMPVTPQHRRRLGDSIRTRRKGQELTQERLAERAELSTVFISRVECGKESPSFDSLVKIARALGVRVKDLVAEV